MVKGCHFYLGHGAVRKVERVIYASPKAVRWCWHCASIIYSRPDWPGRLAALARVRRLAQLLRCACQEAYAVVSVTLSWSWRFIKRNI